MARGSRRTVGALSAIAVLAPLAGCAFILPFGAQDPSPSPSPTKDPPLVAPLSLIPVEAASDGDCPEGAVDAYQDDDTCLVLRAADAVTVSETAEVERPRSENGWNVAITMVDDDRAAFEALTADLAARADPQNRLAIVLDDDVVSAPTVLQAIPGGQLAVAFSEKDEADEFYRELVGLDH